MRILHTAIGVTIAALLGLSVWGCIGLTNHIIVAVDKFGAASTSFADAGAGIAQTTAKLNGPHGTIAMMDEDAGAAKSLIVHADLAARHEQQQLTTWDARGDVLFTNINGGVTDLRTTITAATGTANEATVTLNEAERTLAAFQPVLDHSDATIADVDALFKDQAIHRTFDHVESITASGDKIAADAAFEADKFTHPPKKKLTFWGGVYTAVEWIHKVEPPLF
jgi:hypothetical protein